YIAARKQYRLDTLVQNLSLQHVHPFAVGDVAEVYAQIVHLEKKFCLADVGIYCQEKLKAKALVSARIVKK
ncbi:MAG: hotdog domain-containing protein, partial [Clostridia bacterium]|nr:hotdog domain-containing protein [Clostridia bacterium]